MLTSDALNLIGQSVCDKLRFNVKDVSYAPGYPPPYTTGKLYNSIRYEVIDGGILRVYAEDYIYELANGRKPGGNAKALAGDLKEWVMIKLGYTELTKATQVAYQIAKSIVKKGTLYYQMGGTTILSSVINPQLSAEIRDKLALELTAEIRADMLKMGRVA
jgi:hypothetical protein